MTQTGGILRVFRGRRSPQGTPENGRLGKGGISTRCLFDHVETRERLYRTVAEQRARRAAGLFGPADGEPLRSREGLPRLFRRTAAPLHVRPAQGGAGGACLGP